MGYRIGIDVGGTFTDFVLARPDGSITFTKTASTPSDQSDGVMRGIADLAEAAGLDTEGLLERTGQIVHGTTTGDNILIEMNGAVTGLITTMGNRDQIEFRRGWKENIWDPAYPPPVPIAPRRRRIDVPERLDPDGTVLTPLDEEAVRGAARKLKLKGTESIAVTFLFSYVNPAHELRAREIILEEHPEAHVSLSHEVMSSAPEFERTSTTLVNAYIEPRIRGYLDTLTAKLHDAGFAHDLLVMLSNGGVMTTEYVARKAVSIIGSGPAGGVTGACYVADAAGIADFIAVDIGGTSYDVCLVRGGRPAVKSFWNWRHRYLIGLPSIDVQAIGAGGGSIARVVAGALQVGPESAGAEPGPVCYNRGGRSPTVTDANLVLGYLNPGAFAGGKLKLSTEGVRESIEEQVGRPLGLDATAAAYGIFRIVNANMTHAIRRASSEQGYDPKDFTLVAYGGNGAVHAGVQAREMGIAKVIVPKSAPAFSALGVLISDRLVEDTRSYIVGVPEADLDRVNTLLQEMEEAAGAELGSFGGGDIESSRFTNMRYPGQQFDLSVPLPAGTVVRADLEGAAESFHRLHEESHTYAQRDQAPIISSLRLRAALPGSKVALPEASRAEDLPTPKLHRRAYFDGYVDTPVYDGPSLGAGARVEGPAIIEEPFTTIVVWPQDTAEVDRWGNYVMNIG